MRPPGRRGKNASHRDALVALDPALPVLIHLAAGFAHQVLAEPLEEGAPMTYLATGRQFIVVAIRDQDTPERLVALALGPVGD